MVCRQKNRIQDHHRRRIRYQNLWKMIFFGNVGNRLESVKDSIRDLGDPEDTMVKIMSILNETVIIPDW